jgi:hypothetical protein
VSNPGKDPVMLRYQWISAAAAILLFWAFFAYDAIQKEEVEEKHWPWHEQPFVEHTDLKIDKKFKVHVSGIWLHAKYAGMTDSVFWLDNDTLLLAGNTETKDPREQPLSLYVWRIGREPIHLVRAPRRDEHSREQGLLDPSLGLWNGVTACGGQGNIIYTSGHIPMEYRKALRVYKRTNTNNIFNEYNSTETEIVNENLNSDRKVGAVLRVDCSIKYYKSDFRGSIIPLPFLDGRSYIDIENHKNSKIVFGENHYISDSIYTKNYLYDYNRNKVLFPTGTLAGQFPGKRFELCIGYNELDAGGIKTKFCIPEGPWTKGGGYFSLINNGIIISDKNNRPNILYTSDRDKSWDFVEIGQGAITTLISSPDQCKVLVNASCRLNSECSGFNNAIKRSHGHYVVIDLCDLLDDQRE